MPRHSFSFPRKVRDAVKRHVEKAVNSVDPRRYKQEHVYTTALAKALEGTAYESTDASVVFQSTIVNDRGPNAAESWSGADLAITADISDITTHVRKAILIQAKRGSLSDLSTSESTRLRGQIEDMRRLTRSPKIMDIQDRGSVADPGIYSGNVYHGGTIPKRYRIADYFVQRILTTLDGDTCSDFIDGVQNSGLTMLKVSATKHARQSERSGR